MCTYTMEWDGTGMVAKLYIISMFKLKTQVQNVVPHKAAAEVSKIGRYRRGELLKGMDGRANPLMDQKV